MADSSPWRWVMGEGAGDERFPGPMRPTMDDIGGFVEDVAAKKGPRWSFGPQRGSRSQLQSASGLKCSFWFAASPGGGTDALTRHERFKRFLDSCKLHM